MLSASEWCDAVMHVFIRPGRGSENHSCFVWAEVGHPRSVHLFSLQYVVTHCYWLPPFKINQAAADTDSQGGDKTSPRTDRGSSLTPPPCPLPVTQINQQGEHWGVVLFSQTGVSIRITVSPSFCRPPVPNPQSAEQELSSYSSFIIPREV